MMSFIQKITKADGTIIDDWAQLNIYDRLELHTEAGLVTVLANSDTIMTAGPEGGKNVAVKSDLVTLLGVTVAFYCCSEQALTDKARKCLSCGVEVTWAEIVEVIVRDFRLGSTWLAEEAFLTEVSPWLTSDALTNILYAHELYLFLTTHYKPKP